MNEGKMELKINSSHYVVSDDERKQIEESLERLRKMVESFPVATLHLDVNRHARSKDFHVKASLHLPKQTLFTGERSELFYHACERCIRKLLRKVNAYKERMSKKAEKQRQVQGTVHGVLPAREPDMDELERAVREHDYPSFRSVLDAYDDSLHRRAADLINRFPDAKAHLGEEIVLSEIVEETYLHAFEGFRSRPTTRLGNWLEGLIEPSIKAIVEDWEAEKRNLSFIEEIKPPTYR